MTPDEIKVLAERVSSDGYYRMNHGDFTELARAALDGLRAQAEVERLRARLADATAQRDELAALQHAEDRPVRAELRLAKADAADFRTLWPLLDAFIDANGADNGFVTAMARLSVAYRVIRARRAGGGK